MPPSRDEATVVDMLLATRRVREFTSDVDYPNFEQDLKTQSATIFQILLIGEAAKRLSDEFCNRYSQVPWSDIKRMRDRLIHHYETIDVEEVWRTAIQDIPQLAEFLASLAPSPEG